MLSGGVKVLADFIAGVESGGSYDVVFGHHATPKPITSMTLAELHAAQLAWSAPWRSSAAGRYQVMAQTLADYIAASRVNANATIFSPDTQDAIFLWLLRRRGWDDFLTNRIDLNAFAKNLAEEWASMPVLAVTQGAHRVVAPGETYYAGDRLNRALVSVSAFSAALSAAKAAG